MPPDPYIGELPGWRMRCALKRVLVKYFGYRKNWWLRSRVSPYKSVAPMERQGSPNHQFFAVPKNCISKMSLVLTSIVITQMKTHSSFRIMLPVHTTSIIKSHEMYHLCMERAFAFTVNPPPPYTAKAKQKN